MPEEKILVKLLPSALTDAQRVFFYLQGWGIKSVLYR